MFYQSLKVGYKSDLAFGQVAEHLLGSPTARGYLEFFIPQGRGNLYLALSHSRCNFPNNLIGMCLDYLYIRECPRVHGEMEIKM